jgi:hypothetical protein
MGVFIQPASLIFLAKSNQKVQSNLRVVVIARAPRLERMLSADCSTYIALFWIGPHRLSSLVNLRYDHQICDPGWFPAYSD